MPMGISRGLFMTTLDSNAIVDPLQPANAQLHGTVQSHNYQNVSVQYDPNRNMLLKIYLKSRLVARVWYTKMTKIA